jgi:hypothetical protein
MVAEAQTRPGTAKADGGEQPLTDEGQQPRGGVRRLIGSATRVASLQFKIWITTAKMIAVRIAVSTGLFLGSAVFGILAVVFLLIGIFKFLTDFVGIPVWATYLIFAGVLLLIAGVLVFIAMRMLKKDKDDDDDDDKDKHRGEGR